MPSNPFARKRTPLGEARRRLDVARAEAADAARGVREAADDVVRTLDSGTASKRLPAIAAVAAALLAALYVAKRSRGSSEPSASTAPPPTKPTAASTPSTAATPSNF
jgi:hypothetical protein